MTYAETFSIGAFWQGRPETPARIANRIRLFIAYSKVALPPDTQWYYWLEDCLFDIEQEPQKLEPCVKERICRDDDDEPIPELGHNINLTSFRGNPADRNLSAVIKLTVGSQTQNSFSLSTDSQYADKTDPRLVTYSAMRTTMLAVAASFEPEWCEARPSRLADYYDYRVYNRPPMGLAWMFWFNPTLAPLIKPPRYSYPIVEPYQDGSLFLATSTETFDCNRLTHIEQARAIHREIDPLNYTLPFDGRCGRSDRVPPFPKV